MQINTLNQFIFFFLVLIDVGAAVRILYCIIRIMGNVDEAKSYIKKIIHLLVFLVLANTAIITPTLIEKYYR